MDPLTFFRECDNPCAVDNILFFVGLHQPHDAQHFLHCCISIHRLARRTSAFDVGEWVMDSGAFTTLATHGAYPTPVAAYAAHIRRWSTVGMLQAAVAQDYMCEPAMLRRTGV